MTSSHMVCHLIDQLRIALGELPTQPVSGVVRYSLFKQLVINVFPWPIGRIQGPPEAFTTVSSEWQKDLTRLQQLVEEFGRREAQTEWAPHPMFGRMSDLRRWGLKLAERGGKNAKKRAVVPVARKLARQTKTGFKFCVVSRCDPATALILAMSWFNPT